MQHNVSSTLGRTHNFKFKANRALVERSEVGGDRIAKYARKAKKRYEALIEAPVSRIAKHARKAKKRYEALIEAPVSEARDAVKSAPSDIIIGGTVASASGYVTTKVDKWASNAYKTMKKIWSARKSPKAARALKVAGKIARKGR